MTDEKTTKSLERKTKKELIEIILRKDSVENNLRETNKQLIANNEDYKLKIEELNELYDSNTEKIEELKEDYQNVCDENESLFRTTVNLKGIRKFLIGSLCITCLYGFIITCICVLC